MFFGFMAQAQAVLALPWVTQRELPSPIPTMQPAEVRAVN